VHETFSTTVHGPNCHYPVLGAAFRGLDVIDKIVAAARDERDIPLEPIAMKVTVKE
jgi:hypothetical protein